MRQRGTVLLWGAAIVPFAVGLHFHLPLHLHVHLQHRQVHGSPAGYAGLVLASVASWIGLPGPGEAALITSGVLASHNRLSIGPVLLYAFIGATAGGIGGWLIGRKAGRALVTAPGPLLKIRTAALHRGEQAFARFGVIAVFLVPSWVAGINDMSAARFLPLNALAAAGWALGYGLVAFFVGPSATEVFGDLGTIGAIALGVVVVIVALVLLLRSRLRPRRADGG